MFTSGLTQRKSSNLSLICDNKGNPWETISDPKLFPPKLRFLTGSLQRPRKSREYGWYYNQKSNRMQNAILEVVKDFQRLDFGLVAKATYHCWHTFAFQQVVWNQTIFTRIRRYLRRNLLWPGSWSSPLSRSDISQSERRRTPDFSLVESKNSFHTTGNRLRFREVFTDGSVNDTNDRTLGNFRFGNPFLSARRIENQQKHSGEGFKKRKKNKHQNPERGFRSFSQAWKATKMISSHSPDTIPRISSLMDIHR